MDLKAIALALMLLPGTVLAQGRARSCDFPQLKNQHRDIATVRRLETAWSEAYLRGDANLMSCLLAPDFTEIMRSGELKTVSGELDMAENNRGKDLKMPELPRIRVLLHGNAAVAYGRTIVKTGGKTETRWYSDTYLWRNGQWHAFFAQQTVADVR